MLKTFSDIFTEDVAKFCDSLSPVKKHNPDELFEVHEEEDYGLIPDVPKDEPKKEDITSDGDEVQAQLSHLSDDDIDRIAKAIVKMQTEMKGE